MVYLKCSNCGCLQASSLSIHAIGKNLTHDEKDIWVRQTQLMATSLWHPCDSRHDWLTGGLTSRGAHIKLKAQNIAMSPSHKSHVEVSRVNNGVTHMRKTWKYFPFVLLSEGMMGVRLNQANLIRCTGKTACARRCYAAITHKPRCCPTCQLWSHPCGKTWR